MKKLFVAAALALVTLTGMAKTVVIDVRTPKEYAESHIPNALNLEHGSIGEQIAAAGVARDDKVILYCLSGRRAGIALDTLKNMGYRNVENYGSMEQARQRLKP